MTTSDNFPFPVYLFYFAEDNRQFIYVCADEDRTHESYRLFVGSGDTMEEIILPADGWGVHSFRSGPTSVGNDTCGLFVPQPRTGKPATWNSRPKETHELTRLDPNDYVIVESPEGEVTITKR